MAIKLSGKSKTYLILFLLAILVFAWSKRGEFEKWQRRRSRNATSPDALATAIPQENATQKIEAILAFIDSMINRLQRAPLPRDTVAEADSSGATFTPWFVVPPDTEIAGDTASTNAIGETIEPALPVAGITTFPVLSQTYRNHSGEWLAKDQGGTVFRVDDVWQAPDGRRLRYVAIEHQWIWMAPADPQFDLAAEYRPTPLRITSAIPTGDRQVLFRDVPRPLRQGETLIWNGYRYAILEIGGNHIQYSVTPPTDPGSAFTLYCIGL